MEGYPAELLVGVFPLVFCVDATLSSKATAGTEDTLAGNPTRTEFDRFLDAMAASLLEEPEGGVRLFSDDRRHRNHDEVMQGLFGGEHVMDSDQEDEVILNGAALPNTIPGIAGDMEIRRNRSFGFRGPGGNRNLRATPSKDSDDNAGLNTSFAKTLQDGQGFFQRARIVSISARHGFPPSKDPSGTNNRTQDFFLGKTLRTGRILSATKNRPIDGILPSGWLEKHAAALPSVILVVVEISSHQTQHQQDELLKETMLNLQISLANKRQCSIHIVGLVQDGISPIMAEQWVQGPAQEVEGEPTITLLDVADIQQDAAPSQTLSQLHQTVHDASLRYYMTQARRTKHKLYKLGSARATPLLLPLCIRYCFKVAMFYEFQWLPEKSLRYMIEAYRLVEIYYRYLLQQREIGNMGESRTASNDGHKGPEIHLSGHAQTSTGGGDAEGVEMAIQSGDDINNLLLNPPHLPDDMVFQCRKLADWLNFKILQSGLTSHTEGGLLTASMQWQKHMHAFCNPRSFACNSEDAYMDWSFVAHQRLVASQLLERHPPRILGELGGNFDEVLLRCSPWRTYQAAAESFLRLGVEVKKASSSTRSETLSNADEMRSRYVGGLDKDGYQPKLQEELKINHRERALSCLERALELYEREILKAESKSPVPGIPWKRSGARLHYLAGGILTGLERYKEAVPHLLKAAKLAKGWSGLEYSIRMVVLDCCENYASTDSSDNTEELLSLLADACFFTNMSDSDLKKALEVLARINGGRTIKWYRESFGESDATVPFSFILTFPSKTHAIAGESVAANLIIRSNLQYAIKVNEAVLTTLVGRTPIPSSDLIGAKNADQSHDGGIVIQPNAEVSIHTQIKLPKDLNDIRASDESEDLGGAPPKPIIPKHARPRTGGVTAAGGARLASQTVFGLDPKSSDFQWSRKCLGGKPFRCDMLSLVFSPVFLATSDAESSAQIEYTIEKKRVYSNVHLKRSQFEAENYLCSTWERPKNLPLDLGPRCLRVVPPTSEMIITNLSEPHTNGKVLEGTVNRVLLRLDAGKYEKCTDVSIRVNCLSTLLATDGKTLKITSNANGESSDDAGELRIDPAKASARKPVLVKEDRDASGTTTDSGHSVPSGWKVADNDSDEYEPVQMLLDSGKSTYAAFEIFRPSPSLATIDGVVQIDDITEDLMLEHSACTSHVEVSVRYRQEMSTSNEEQMNGADKDRGTLEDSEATETPSTGADLVFLNKTISLTWEAPISVDFSAGETAPIPSGNRHPRNVLSQSDRGSIAKATQTEFVLVDKERFSTNCTLEAAAANDGLTLNIREVRYEDACVEGSPCSFKLLSGKDEKGLLYRARGDDASSILKQGSKLCLAWFNEVNLQNEYRKGSVSSSLGIISIDWLPSPIAVPRELQKEQILSTNYHGPLEPSSPIRCRFNGPPCYVENSPFETKISQLPDIITVMSSFDVQYTITNKTPVDQQLQVEVKSPDDDTEGLVFFGSTKTDVSVGPHETFTISYTALPVRTGKVPVPSLSVSSARYNAWVMHSPNEFAATIFVIP